MEAAIVESWLYLDSGEFSKDKRHNSTIYIYIFFNSWFFKKIFIYLFILILAVLVLHS